MAPKTITPPPPEKPAQLTARIDPSVFTSFKIALLKNNEKKEYVLEKLMKGYIKNG